MPQSGFHVEVHGLQQLRRDLKVIDKKLPRELNKTIKAAAEPVRAQAAALAPYRTGATRASLKVGTRGSKVVIYSRRPGASVIHWGGRHPLFGDRSHWFQQRPSMFISRAATSHAGSIERDVARVVEQVMRDAGFR